MFSKFNKYPSVQLSLGEGNTPVRFVELSGNYLVAIKDENLNPTGSFKDRSLVYQISSYVDKGFTKFAISSSGNAAISAATICKENDLEITIFISENINVQKLGKLEDISKDSKIKIIKSKKAKSDCVKYANENNLVNLVGSKDDSAMIGFKSLAYEISVQCPVVDAIFMPCSSGTSALGLMNGFKDLGKNIPIIICQTTSIHPIADKFNSKIDVKEEKSLADAIIDRVALRKNQVVENLYDCNGKALIITNDELLNVEKLIKQYNLNYSYNSLLGLAGLLQMPHKKYLHPLIIATGL